MGYTKEQIEAAVKAKGYVWFEDANNKGFDVNIVGVRNDSTGDKVTNVFDDYITLSYKENGEKKFHIWPATTDPGTKGVIDILIQVDGSSVEFSNRNICINNKHSAICITLSVVGHASMPPAIKTI